MRAEYGFIAESADVVNGLFYVVRGGTDIWHTLPGTTFPMTIGPMSFVVRLVGDPQQAEIVFPLEFTVVDADAQPIGVQGSGEIRFSTHPIDRTREAGAMMHFRMVIPIPKPGAYFFEIHSVGSRLCQIPFWVVPAEQTGE